MIKKLIFKIVPNAKKILALKVKIKLLKMLTVLNYKPLWKLKLMNNYDKNQTDKQYILEKEINFQTFKEKFQIFY